MAASTRAEVPVIVSSSVAGGECHGRVARSRTTPHVPRLPLATPTPRIVVARGERSREPAASGSSPTEPLGVDAETAERDFVSQHVIYRLVVVRVPASRGAQKSGRVARTRPVCPTLFTFGVPIRV
jgi:hypothetical protein